MANNVWEQYTEAQIWGFRNKAYNAAWLHTNAGRPYMADLCEKRGKELDAELERRKQA